jgi:hypothetical protein
MFLKNFRRFAQSKLIYLFACLLLNQTILSEGFLQGTLVKTSESYKPIDQLKENDLVTSYSFKDKCLMQGKITKVNKKHYKTWIKLIINSNEIITAPDHKFYCPITEGTRWVKAKDLKSSDFISVDLTNCVRVSKIEELNQEADFYCLFIEKYQNFFVTEQNIFVHNFAALIPIFEVLIAAGIRCFGNYGVLRSTIASLSTMELYRRLNLHGWNLWDKEVKLPDPNKIKHIFGKENGQGKKHGFIGGPNDEDPQKWWQKIARRVKEAYLNGEIKENGKDFEIYEKQNVNPNFGDLTIRGIIINGVIHVGDAFLKIIKK